MKSGSLSFLEPTGLSRPVMGLIYLLPDNASRWQMGFNWAFKGLKCPLTLTPLMWRIW
jgi:hypothetical protein